MSDTYGFRREEAARQTGAKIYKRHQELLEDKSVDVVCIATPDRLHVPQALEAIHAGKDVYCEKPMGHWAQFDLSKKFYQETVRLKRIVQIGNQANSSPEWKKVADLVQGGAIGRVQHVQAGFYRYGDWGERMPIPDRTAKPGPDLDWEAFLGDAPKVPFTVDRYFSWRKCPRLCRRSLHRSLPACVHAVCQHPRFEVPIAGGGLGRAFSNTTTTTGRCRTPSTCASTTRRSFR